MTAAWFRFDHTVAPEELFCNDYPYFSSVSDALQVHTIANVQGHPGASRARSRTAWWSSLASNDGYLLKHYKQAGIKVLGIDPAEPPAKAAMAIGVDTLIDFFTAGAGAASSPPKASRRMFCMPTMCSRTWPTRTALSRALRAC